MKQELRVQHLIDQIKITNPSKKNTKSILRLSIWLIWQLITSTLILGFLYLAFSDNIEQIWLIILFVLAIFSMSIPTLTGLYVFLWQISGEEIIYISATEIKIQRKILRVGKMKEYKTDVVSKIDVLEPKQFPFRFGKFKFGAFDMPFTGKLGFSIKNAWIHFGLDMDTNDAKSILAEIHQKFPEYSPSRS